MSGIVQKREVIDKSTFDRYETFKFFLDFTKPHFEVSSKVDVSGLKRLSEKTKNPFGGYLNFAVLQATNSVKNLRYRLEGDEIVLYDTIGIVIPLPGKDENYGSYGIFSNDLSGFMEEYKKGIEWCKSTGGRSYNAGKGPLYTSCLPWIHITSFVAPHQTTRDTSPQVVWDKLKVKGDKITVNMSISVHHSFCDGYHVGLFFQELERQIELLSKTQ